MLRIIMGLLCCISHFLLFFFCLGNLFFCYYQQLVVNQTFIIINFFHNNQTINYITQQLKSSSKYLKNINMFPSPEIIKYIPETTSTLVRKLSLVQLIYKKYRKIKDQITNKSIEYMLANEGILSGQLQPNTEAYLREYSKIIKQSEQAQNLLIENQQTIDQCLWVVDSMLYKLATMGDNCLQEISRQQCQQLNSKREQDLKQVNEQELKAETQISGTNIQQQWKQMNKQEKLKTKTKEKSMRKNKDKYKNKNRQNTAQYDQFQNRQKPKSESKRKVQAKSITKTQKKEMKRNKYKKQKKYSENNKVKYEVKYELLQKMPSNYQQHPFEQQIKILLDEQEHDQK